MNGMDGMPMPGGWMMSMAWMRTPGESWPAAAASFLGMWLAMMVAMMLPALTPMLWNYRQAIGRVGTPRLAGLTALAGTAYFSTWALLGLAIFPLGATLAGLEMETPALARAVPLAASLSVLIAGALQLTRWKAHQLGCCREASKRRDALPADAVTAWRCGLRLGAHCCYCCSNLTAMLLAVGVMDLRAMLIVTAAISAERLAPAGERIARITGACLIAAGLVLSAQSLLALRNPVLP